MTDCVLPVTGSNPSLVLLALLAIPAGVALVLGVRRRGIGGGAAVVIAFALAAAGLVIGDALESRRAGVPTLDDCRGDAGSDDGRPTTTAAAATTTVSFDDDRVDNDHDDRGGWNVPINPTTTSSTTTTVGVPDLTPTVTGPQDLVLFDQNVALYTVSVQNIGTAPTDGNTMTFTVTLPFSAIGNNGGLLSLGNDPSTADWTVVETLGTFQTSPGVPGTPTVLTITSTSGFVLAAGASSSLSLILQLQVEDVAQFSVDVALPPLIGGETNAANNTASLPVTITAPAPD